MTDVIKNLSGMKLLEHCWKSGIYLSLKDGRISYKATAGMMSSELLATIKAHKEELITHLQESPDYFAARPLSANEKALWFMYRMNPNSSAYNMAYAVKLSAGTHGEAVNAAFKKLIESHSILSCPYDERDGEAIQWLNKPTSPSIARAYKNNQKPEQIKKILCGKADVPFSLESGELCRAFLLENNTEKGIDCYLLMTVHHIVADFISFEQLRKDFLALLDQQVLAPIDTAYSYKDWSAEQYGYLQGSEQHQEDRAFWVKKIGDAPQLQLPTDFAYTKDLGAEGEEVDFVLASAQAQAIRDNCKQLGVTPYSWWLSAFQWFLSRLSGQNDFVIGTPSAGRLSQEHQSLIGYLVNPLVLRCQPNNQQAFKEWVIHTNKEVRECLAHQRYPFAELIQTLNIERESGRNLLFQHMFTLNHERANLFDDTLISEELLAEQRGAAHELNLVIVDNRAQFKGKWRYNNSLYKRETIDKIKQAFICFVEQLSQNNAKKLGELALNKPLKKSKSQSLMSGESVMPEDKVAPLYKAAWEAFIAQCDTKPDNIALQISQQKISYGELLNRVNAWAHKLGPYLKGSEDNTLGVFLLRSIDQIALMLASWQLGKAYVAMDVEWPLERLHYISENANIGVVVGAGRHPEWLAKDNHWLDITLSNVTATENLLKSNSLEQTLTPTTNQAAYIIYTSGSTGKPKAVVITQGNLIHYVTGVDKQLKLDPTASMASLAGNGADLGYTATFGALLTGRCLRLLSEDLARDADALASELEAFPVDCLKIVPSHLNGLMLASQSASLLPRQLLITGGEALTPQLLNSLWQRKASLRVVNHYGPTETTVGVITAELEASDARQQQAIPLGKPLANVVTRIVDEYGHAVIDGLPGELEIAGPTVAKGYMLAESKNTSSDRASFYQEGETRWYRTGDKVKRNNDLLYFIGRCDFQVKIRGYRVEPAEVEVAIKPYVDDVAVIDYLDERGQCQLAAYIVASNKQISEAKTQLVNTLPNYMLPKRWVMINDLPLTSNGKVDRKKLLAFKSYDAESNKALEKASSQDANRPLTTVEADLLDIWQTLLNKPELGIYDNFFENGGDSILGLQIISQAKKKNIVLTPKSIFEKQTIAELAKIVEPSLSPVEEKLLAISQSLLNKPDLTINDNFFEVGGDSILSLQLIAKAKAQQIAITPKQIFGYPTIQALAGVAVFEELATKAQAVVKLPQKPFAITPIQQWFFEQEQLNPGHWNQSLLLNVKAQIDLSCLKKAVADVIKAHASLRLCFVQGESSQNKTQWMQCYQAYSNDWLPELVTIEDELLDNNSLYHAQAGFNLSSGPLIRFVWFTQTNQLLCTAHHLIVDAVSWKIILGDLQESYSAYVQGEEEVVIDPVAAHFHQWSELLVNYKQSSDKIEAHYWLEQAQQELPKTHKDNTYTNTLHEIIRLNQSLTKALLVDCQQAYNTRVQEFLLAPLVKVLCEWQQLTEMTIELEGHGREAQVINSDVDLSRTVGWFTSRYPQKIAYHKEQENQLVTTKEQLRRTPHNGLSYGLARYLHSGNGEPKQWSGAWPEHSFVSFNYLGIQNQDKANSLFVLDNMLCPGSRARENQRPHLIDINAVVVDGELSIDWCFPNDTAYSRVPDIAKAYQAALEQMITFCQHPEHGRATAADFPNAQLSDKEFLDLLVELDD